MLKKCVVVIHLIFGLIIGLVLSSRGENVPVLKDIEVAVKKVQNLRLRVHKLRKQLDKKL